MMRRHDYLFYIGMLALLLAACTAAPQSSSTEEASLIVSAETAKPAATPEQATPAVRREQVTVEREVSATLYDGGPLPQQSQPLYYIGNWQGLTWEELAAKTKRRTPASRAATSMCRNPLMLTSLVVTGSLMLRGTEPSAAS